MTRTIVNQALNEGAGVMRLAPNWVPRTFCRPGRRLRLHPDDYFALGLERGGIDERWFSSTTPADNGPGTPGKPGSELCGDVRWKAGALAGRGERF